MRKIFIDGGGHCGCSRKKFKAVFDTNNEYEIFSFEPDSGFNKYCPDLINKALSDNDGVFKYYKYNLTGASSIVKKRADLINWAFPKVIDVECIDLSKWIENNFQLNDYIILKLDVEGAEYQILRHMLENKTISYINKLYIEWHDFRVGVDKSVNVELEDAIKKFDVEIDIWDAMKTVHCIGRNK